MSPLTETDLLYLGKALELAGRGRYSAAPNPRVGSVVVSSDRIVGEGWHRRAGEAHAEVVALDDAGAQARGGTLYVNLEPCSHHGRTPPCVEAIVEAGVKRVVACSADPDPRVQGRGFEYLEQHGVEVSFAGLVEEAIELNLAYLVQRSYGRPCVTLKWAMSLDGRIATASGESQWISSPEGRRQALLLREEHDAILVGSGTVLADDPRLNRRCEEASGAICRVVLDRRLRTPAEAQLFEVEGQVLIYTENQAAQQRSALEERGAEVVVLETVEPEPVLADLASRSVQSVLVEGGGEINGAFARSGPFDRVWVCCAPLLIGGDRAPGPVRGPGIERLVEGPGLARLRATAAGPDLILTGVHRECLQALSTSVVSLKR